MVGSGEMPLLSKALKTESYSKIRKAVRYVVLCLFAFLSFLYSKYTLTVFFNVAYRPERGSRPAKVELARFQKKEPLRHK